MIEVVFFASLRETLGSSGMRCPAVAAADIEQLLQYLSQQLTAQQMQDLSAPNVRIAVNQQLVEGNIMLSDGDEVAFLPPVTGG